jgi:hypothetical protein
MVIKLLINTLVSFGEIPGNLKFSLAKIPGNYMIQPEEYSIETHKSA